MTEGWRQRALPPATPPPAPQSHMQPPLKQNIFWRIQEEYERCQGSVSRLHAERDKAVSDVEKVREELERCQSTLGKVQLSQEKTQQGLDKAQNEVERLQERLDKATVEARKVSFFFFFFFFFFVLFFFFFSLYVSPSRCLSISISIRVSIHLCETNSFHIGRFIGMSCVTCQRAEWRRHRRRRSIFRILTASKWGPFHRDSQSTRTIYLNLI